jgi:spore maturation protein CgeB
MKVLCAFGLHAYGDPRRGESYEYVHFIPALRSLGHQVVLFDSWDRSAHTDFLALNLAFLETVERERPDIIFCVLMGYELWQETLALARRGGAPLLIWATDDSWKFGQFSKFVAPSFDLWATTYERARAQARRAGISNFVLTQWAASSSRLVEPLPAKECNYAVSFVGAAYGNRPRWIRKLKERGIDVSCFGHGWKGGPVSTDDVRRIIRQSVVSLNFGDSGIHFRGLWPFRSRQIKARVFEVPGVGGLLLTEPAEGIGKFFVVGKEIEVFRDADELADKIRYFSNHPEVRDAVARAGFERVRKEHTYEARFKELLSHPVLARGSGQSSRPIDFAAFERIAVRHRIGCVQRLLRFILVAPLRLIWGSDRGTRAARRLLFEISWRMAGKRTYSAAGLPGRLFYRES